MDHFRLRRCILIVVALAACLGVVTLGLWTEIPPSSAVAEGAGLAAYAGEQLADAALHVDDGADSHLVPPTGRGEADTRRRAHWQRDRLSVGERDPIVAAPAGHPVTVAISGTVTGPGGLAVGDVRINVGSYLDWYEPETDASGFYSAQIETDGFLWFDVLPELETRMVQFGLLKHGVSESFGQDFSLDQGHLLQVDLIGRQGDPLTAGQAWLSVQQLLNKPGPDTYYLLPWIAEDECYESVLPPDIYYLLTHNEPEGYHATRAPFDLRDGDLTAEMVLNTTYVHPVPYEPPRAERISFGSPNDLGEVVVTGAPGAVLPLAHVLLGNVHATHQAHVISEGDGSFTATLYAPPGSAVLVRHGPPDEAWQQVAYHGENLQRFSGTIINRPHTHEAPPGSVPFATVGGIGIVEGGGDPPIRGSVGAAWALKGWIRRGAGHTRTGEGGTTASTLSLAPGESFEISATIRIQSHAINAASDPLGTEVSALASLVMIYDEQGRPVGSENFSGSNRLTPSGFPIRSADRPLYDLDLEVPVSGLHHAQGHTLEGSLAISAHVPTDVPPGVYRPVLRVWSSGVPTSTEWLSGKTLENYRTFLHDEAALPPVVIADEELASNSSSEGRRLIWRLLRNTPVQGTRGASAREDAQRFQPGTFIVTQGASYGVPLVDPRGGERVTYRLEPFLPMISYSERRTPAPPLIPFDLPGGELCVAIRRPDHTVRDLGCEAFSQSFIRTITTRAGEELNSNSVQLADVYSLKVGSDRFHIQFEEYGHHVITMMGTVQDIWGATYDGGGTYDVWVARPLDLDPGVLPGTPLAVGDVVNPAVQVYPRVPARVDVTTTLYPGSDPARAVSQTVSGRANRYGYFGGGEEGSPLTGPTQSDPLLSEPGEFRVDVTAVYTDAAGEVYLGAMTWGSVVMTPPAEAQLRAHGQRGVDVWDGMAPQWFLFNDLCIPNAHLYNAYQNGDIVWSRTSDVACSGDSLIIAANMADNVGSIASRIKERYQRMNPIIYGPWVDFDTRIDVGQIPTFSSTSSGLAPLMAQDHQDQICYSYQSSQRPGVRVREDVTESGHQGCGYWRFDDLYDYQLGVGIEGDLPNDYKFQYVGIVFRDLANGDAEYLGQGSGWVHLPEDDVLGSRVMPPFAGPGNGGWTTQGGPIMTLKGEDIHIFILPTGVRPGAVLEVGDTFRFAGHVMPTLASQVGFTVTAPGGTRRVITGTANSIGYFYDPEGDFAVDETGLWSVDVRVWHDGRCSGGQTMPPYPSGGVLGTDDGRFWFYVVPDDQPRLDVSTPRPGFLSIDGEVPPVDITGQVPDGLGDVTIDYTISMPGFVLETGQVTPSGGVYTIRFDPTALHEDFPNLDLTEREDHLVGLSDTFAVGLLLQGERDGDRVCRANTVTIQGEHVFVGDSLPELPYEVVLPVVLRHGEDRDAGG